MINRRAEYGILEAQVIKELTRQIWWADGRDTMVKGKEKVVQYPNLALLLIISMKEYQLLLRDFM